MKIAPVSADLLIKLAMLAAVGVAGYLIVQRLRGSVPSFANVRQAASEALDDVGLYMDTGRAVAGLYGVPDEHIGDPDFYPDPVAVREAVALGSPAPGLWQLSDIAAP
jgi:hypothetical protein